MEDGPACVGNIFGSALLQPVRSVCVSRSSAAIPDVEVRPEIEFRQEQEIDNPAKIEVSVSTICEWDLGPTGPITAEKPSEIAETVSRYT